MAINVNIPGLGTVTVDGAASEETAKQILTAMQTFNRRAAAAQRQTQPSRQSTPGDGQSDMRRLIESTRAQLQQQTMLSRAVGSTVTFLKDLTGSAAKGVLNVFKDIAKVGLAVTTAWMTSAESMASDPIRAGAELINTGIDLLSKSVTTVTDAITKIAGGLPLVGGVIKGAGEAFKAAVELASTVLKTANEFMAAEFQKTVAGFGKLNRIGATFANGMDELRGITVDSGVSFNTFVDAVANSRESITAMGLTAANAAKLVSNGLSRLATTVNSSGKSLRDELLLLGYDYREQGELIAEYTASMVAAGKSRADIDRDVEQGTARYAKSLKIISDITGEDARKKMAESRRESMRASLMNKLSADQRQAFMEAYTSMSQFPELQEALIQKLAIGEVISPAVAMNETFMKLINDTARGVESGSKEIITETLTGIANAAEELRTKGKDLGTAIDIAKIAGASGVVATAADIFNKVAAVQMTPEQIQQAKEAIAANSRNAGASSEAFARAKSATEGFAIEMEKLANNSLPGYAKLIQTTTVEVTTALKAAINEAQEIARQGIQSYAEQRKEDIKRAAAEQVEKMGGPGTLEKAEGALKGAAYGVSAGAIAGSVIPGLGTAVGSVIGGLLGGITGWYASGTKQEVPKKEKGGTISGPKSGYPVLLHGAEAVVPLPDGRSIPVQISQSLDVSSMIDLSKLEETMKKQSEQIRDLTETMRDMVSVARDHRDISRDLYDVTA